MNLGIKLNAWLILLAAALFVSWFRQETKVRSLEADKRQLQQELAHASVPMERDTIRDTVEVVTQAVAEVGRQKLKRALDRERQLVRELRLKVAQLEAVQTTVVQTSDTVPAKYQERDSIYSYSDQWTDLSFNVKDTTFYYNIRDSLSTVVYREYRHRFLWWRWGTKGYRVKIANFNPHARVTYNKYIKAGK